MSTDLRPRDGAEIVIIGGGVIGCSIAHHLAVAGQHDVLLIERNDLGSGTTSCSAGLVGQLRSSRLLMRFVQRTLRAIRDLDAEFQEPIGYRDVGSLVIASTPEREDELEGQVLAAREEKIAVAWIDAAEARRLAPALDPGLARRIAYLPGDGFIDAYQLATAYARSATARGVRVWTGVGVQDIHAPHGRVTGVATDRGVVECRWVVDAAGPWAGPVAALVGVELPVAPVRSHFWITAPHREILSHQPVIRIPDVRVYTRPEVGGLLIGVHEPDSRAYDARELGPAFQMRQVDRDWDIFTNQLAELLPYFPCLDDARMVDSIAGLTTYPPDGRYVLGRVPTPEGFLVASGCSGLGVAGSGGIGAVIAELVIDGRASLDLTPFRVHRFGAVDPHSVAFRQRCAMARSRKDALPNRRHEPRA